MCDFASILSWTVSVVRFAGGSGLESQGFIKYTSHLHCGIVIDWWIDLGGQRVCEFLAIVTRQPICS